MSAPEWSRHSAIIPCGVSYDAGVPLILNTDDPAMFHTSMNGEYEIAAREFGFSEAELRGLADYSFRAAFKAG